MNAKGRHLIRAWIKEWDKVIRDGGDTQGYSKKQWIRFNIIANTKWDVKLHYDHK